MYSKPQNILLEKFAELSDQLFDLGIITTDSFTGEIGEYVVCKHLKLKKTTRVTRAVDAISSTDEKYQVKAKVVTKSSFNYHITDLETNLFDFLAVIYFDVVYNPIKILIIPSKRIKGGQISITSQLLASGIIIIEREEIKIPATSRKSINDFAKVYSDLHTAGIIRSRRVVGDIGEYYACKRLDLVISEKRNEKGIDARSKSGQTFEIKTRRVYQSERRVSEKRRINGLDGKTADYLIVVILDRSFKCAGMWVLPMKNIINPTSANLKIVNTTIGTQNLIPSKISWLHTGETFTSFNSKATKKLKSTPKKIIRPNKNAGNPKFKKNTFNEVEDNLLSEKTIQNKLGCFGWVAVAIILYLLLKTLSWLT